MYGNGFFLEIVKNFNHMFIHNLDSVNDFSIICDELKELQRVSARGDLGLVGTLSTIPQEES